MRKSSNYLPDVKDQYEDLPYPPRDPQDEKKRLVPTLTDQLEKMNHYGYGGMQTFKEGYRCLVAGGGTGDSTIFLAEQLKAMANVEIIHLDLSSASIEIARERAQVRGLSNITFKQGSLLDVDQLDLGMFDFVNCSGVLHHLDSPDEGLKALKSVLKEDGLMAIMVYGEYGRLGIYPIQEMMRYINKDVDTKTEKLNNCKLMLDQIPSEHTFKAHKNLWLIEQERLGDEGLYDLYLHSQDRAYNVAQIYDWLDRCGLSMLKIGLTPGTPASYNPTLYIQHEGMRNKVLALPQREQQHIAEILNSSMIMHVFYAGNSKDCVASVENKRLVPFHFPKLQANIKIAAAMEKVGSGVLSGKRQGIQVKIEVTPVSTVIMRLIDGKNSISEIIKKTEKKLRKKNIRCNTDAIWQTFKKLYEQLNGVDWMLLRSQRVGKLNSDDFINSWSGDS